MQNENYIFYEYISIYQKNNKIFTEIANTQIYNNVYFWQRGRELNLGRM